MKHQPLDPPALPVFFEEMDGRQNVNLESAHYILATLAKVNGVELPESNEIKSVFPDATGGSVQRMLNDVCCRESLIALRLDQIRHELSKLF